MPSPAPPAFALATPSYGPDYDRCKLLVESVRRFSQTPIRHYIIVDQRDYSQFRSLASASTEILTAEALLPPWIHRFPLVRKAWLSFKTPPIRNWIVQQLVKLSFAQSAPETTTIFVDSDVAFLRPFSLAQFTHGSQTRLFRVPEYYTPAFDPLYAAAYRLLGLGGYRSGVARPNYIGNLISWRQNHVKALGDRLEQLWDRPWIETLARSQTLSEYILYGVFVDQVLGDAASHFYDYSPLCHEYWQPQALSDQQLAEFFAAVQPSHIAVMVSAKARMAPHRYRRYLDRYQAAPPAVVS
ncbi:DUF6492 family protein [Nodosilinea nodulosa]|uniref:DUF6492 family protein n=1 Tax=Nodosilinea nodulosa TaxID=416001 RepID=UPI000305CBBC|nr:DUF6492 family protein [Nodosilinea nodulosa]